MAYSWFSHEKLTHSEAKELVENYQKRGFRCEKLLDSSQLTFTVNVWLPEANHLPRSKIAAPHYWG